PQQRIEQRYNKLGIRRMRMIDAKQVSFANGVVKVKGGTVVEEFVFPREVNAHFACSQSAHESGDVAWIHNIQFSGVRAMMADWEWLQENRYTKWVALVETNNMEVYILGGPKEQGLKLQTSGGTNATHISYSLEAPALSTP